MGLSTRGAFHWLQRCVDDRSWRLNSITITVLTCCGPILAFHRLRGDVLGSALGCGSESRIQFDGRHYPRNRSAGTRLVRLEAVLHGSEQANQLPEHHVEHWAIVIGKIGSTVQRQGII